MFIGVKLAGDHPLNLGVAMSETFTDAARELFAKKSLLHVASLGSDGAPDNAGYFTAKAILILPASGKLH